MDRDFSFIKPVPNTRAWRKCRSREASQENRRFFRLQTSRPLTLSPDGSELLATDVHGVPPIGPLWSFPVLGGSPHRIGDIEAVDARLSPDGKMLAYSNVNELFVAKSDGTESRKVASAKGLDAIFNPVFSHRTKSSCDSMTRTSLPPGFGKLPSIIRTRISCFPVGPSRRIRSAAAFGVRTATSSCTSPRDKFGASLENTASSIPWPNPFNSLRARYPCNHFCPARTARNCSWSGRRCVAS